MGRGFWGPGLVRVLIVSHGWLDSMLPPKVKLNWGDGIKAKGGLISGGSGGPKPPAWVLRKSNTLGSSSWIYARFWNSGSSEVSKWDMFVMGWWISEIVSIIRSLMLYVRVLPSLYGWVLLWETQYLGILYIIGIWPRDLRYDRVCRRSWLTIVFGTRYKGSLEETPWSYLFEEESWGGISGEEM